MPFGLLSTFRRAVVLSAGGGNTVCVADAFALRRRMARSIGRREKL